MSWEAPEEGEKRILFELELGVPVVLGSDVPGSPYGVVFEDDGQAGYAYALDRRRPKRSLDELHVYTVPPGPPRRMRLEMAWDQVGDRVAVMLDGVPVAAFAFSLNMAFSRSGLPEALSGFAASHTWNDQAFSQHWRYLDLLLQLPVEIHRVDEAEQQRLEPAQTVPVQRG